MNPTSTIQMTQSATTSGWDALLPRTIFGILSNGRSAELYPLYLDVLTTLYLQIMDYTTGALPYEQTRSQVESLLTEVGMSRPLPEDEFTDPKLEGSPDVSRSAVILNRLVRSGWLRREWDHINEQDVIRFPAFAYPLLSALQEIRRGETVEYDALMMTILDLLLQDKIQRRQAISQAYRLMVKLVEGVQSLVQQMTSIRLGVQQYEPGETLINSLTSYMESEPVRQYRLFKLRYSPSRWSGDIVRAARLLQEQTQAITVESLARSNPFDVPPPEEVNRTASHIAAQLRYIENNTNRLIEIVHELDEIHRQTSKAYRDRLNAELSSPAASEVIRSVEGLFDLLKTLPRRTDPEVEVKRLFPALRPTTPRSFSYLPRRIGRRNRDAEIEPYLTEEDVKIPQRYRMPSSAEVEAHFDRIFGDRDELSIEALLTDSVEDIRLLLRLVNWCSRNSRFAFAVVFPETTSSDEIYRPPPEVENELLSISQVVIRRRNKDKSIERL